MGYDPKRPEPLMREEINGVPLWLFWVCVAALLSAGLVAISWSIYT